MNARLELLEVVVVLHFNVLFWAAIRQGWVHLWLVLRKWGKYKAIKESLGFIAISILVGQILLASIYLLGISLYQPTYAIDHKWYNNIKPKHHILSHSSSSVIMWGSRPLMTVSTADISVLNTLQRLYTLPTSRVKVQKNFGPNHACADKAQYHTSLGMAA